MYTTHMKANTSLTPHSLTKKLKISLTSASPQFMETREF